MDAEIVSAEEIAKTAFLFEAIGRHSFEPAAEMLMLYVPKNAQKMIPLTRASAIYALGYIWQDAANAQLAGLLATRMLDDNPFDPEDRVVRYSSTLALGRIGDPASRAELQKLEVDSGSPLTRASIWSLQQLRE